MMKSESMSKAVQNIFWLGLIIILTDCTLYLYAQRKETSEYKMYPAPGVPEHVKYTHLNKLSIERTNDVDCKDINKSDMHCSSRLW